MHWPKLLQPRAVLLKHPKPAPSPAHASSAPAASPAPSSAACAATEVNRGAEAAQTCEDTAQQHQAAQPVKPAKPQKQRNLPPTHFLAVRMSTQRVQEAITQLHGALQSHTPGLAPACEAPQKAHITLGVMRLQGQQEVEDAVALLQGRGTALLASAQALKPLTLQVKGLGSFRNSVLFLNVGPDPNNRQLQGSLQHQGALDQQHNAANDAGESGGAADEAAGTSEATTAQGGCGAGVTGAQDLRELSGLPHLHAIASSLGTCFAGVMKEEPHRPFNPHITVCKLSKLARGGGQGRRGRRGGHSSSRRGARTGVQGGGDKDGSSGHAGSASQGAAADGCGAEVSGKAAMQALGDEGPEAMELDAQEQEQETQGQLSAQGQLRVQGQQAGGSEGQKVDLGAQPAAAQEPGPAGDQVQQQHVQLQNWQQHGHEDDPDQQKQRQQQQQQQHHDADRVLRQHADGSNGADLTNAAAGLADEPLLPPRTDSRSSAGTGAGSSKARRHEEAGDLEGDGRCSKRPKTEGSEGLGRAMEVAPCQAAAAQATEESQYASEKCAPQPASTSPEQGTVQAEGQHGSKGATMEQLHALRQQRKEQRHLQKQQKRQQRQQQQQQEGNRQTKGKDTEEQEGDEEEPARKEPKIRSIPIDAIPAALREIDAGEVVAEEIYLCSMAGPKQADGFYRVVASLRLCEHVCTQVHEHPSSLSRAAAQAASVHQLPDQRSAQARTAGPGPFQPLSSGALASPPSSATPPPAPDREAPEKRKRSGCCSIM